MELSLHSSFFSQSKEMLEISTYSKQFATVIRVLMDGRERGDVKKNRAIKVKLCTYSQISIVDRSMGIARLPRRQKDARNV